MPRKKPPIRLAYATDLTDGQWALIEPMIPQAEPGGRPRKAATRELVDAILYFLRAGGGWRLLPHNLPPWQTVYYYLRRWQREGVWDRVHHALVMADRERVGREPSPSAAILDCVSDSQNKALMIPPPDGASESPSPYALRRLIGFEPRFRRRRVSTRRLLRPVQSTRLAATEIKTGASPLEPRAQHQPTSDPRVPAIR